LGYKTPLRHSNMQTVLRDLNPESEPDFVSVYIDDILVYSQTLEEHLHHLQLVIERLQEAGLKLKPTKCHFLRQEIEYLGHMITADGLKPNYKHVSAVQDFAVPRHVKEVRQFLGLAPYYCRFIARFSKIAQPLHARTQKGVPFQWTDACQTAFDTVKRRLIEAPVLRYHNFSKDFVLETDASVKGLGSVLSQIQDDGKLHPVAYAPSSTLSSREELRDLGARDPSRGVGL